MLHVVQQGDLDLVNYLKDDPVRPELGIDFRLRQDNQVFALLSSESNPLSLVCVSYRDCIVCSVDQLLDPYCGTPSVVIFYTIWSYSSGCGKRLIFAVCDWIREHKPQIQHFVTLSPPTELARKFHLGNGASILRQNADSVNYCYSVDGKFPSKF